MVLEVQKGFRGKGTRAPRDLEAVIKLAASAADLITAPASLVEPWHPSSSIPFWILQ